MKLNKTAYLEYLKQFNIKPYNEVQFRYLNCYYFYTEIKNRKSKINVELNSKNYSGKYILTSNYDIKIKFKINPHNLLTFKICNWDGNNFIFFREKIIFDKYERINLQIMDSLSYFPVNFGIWLRYHVNSKL